MDVMALRYRAEMVSPNTAVQKALGDVLPA
jgi:hypothetical protein